LPEIKKNYDSININDSERQIGKNKKAKMRQTSASDDDKKPERKREKSPKRRKAKKNVENPANATIVNPTREGEFMTKSAQSLDKIKSRSVSRDNKGSRAHIDRKGSGGGKAKK